MLVLGIRFFVLDASALMAGPLEATEGVKFATTPGIIEEIHDPTISVRITGWKDAKILHPMEPTPNFVKQVKEAAIKTGDLRVLSENDLNLVSLALELGQTWEDADVTLVCGDFAMQNTARALNIKIDTVSKGIKKTIQWQWYCPACGKRDFRDPTIRECDVCGTPLKRRDAQRQQNRQKSGKRNR
ncbi:MAG TPA: hypothetical protein VKK79_16305 [Candidatus Lokiarchaeia archaeon]|nr:hypothetical protein [Candidatus Lokiarchaeia archaeon]